MREKPDQPRILHSWNYPSKVKQEIKPYSNKQKKMKENLLPVYLSYDKCENLFLKRQCYIGQKLKSM